MNFEKRFIFELKSCTTFYLPSFFIKKLKSKYQRIHNQVFNPEIHCCYSGPVQVKFFKSGITLQGKVNSKSIPFSASAAETVQRCFHQFDL